MTSSWMTARCRRTTISLAALDWLPAATRLTFGRHGPGNGTGSLAEIGPENGLERALESRQCPFLCGLLIGDRFGRASGVPDRPAW